MVIRSSIFVALLVGILAGVSFSATEAAHPPGQDRWQVVVKDAGVEAMHMATFHTDRVAIFDRTNLPSPSNIKLPNGRCRDNPQARTKHDCYAHSVEYDSHTNSIRALFLYTDTFCSAGAFLPDGTLQQVGGDLEGERTTRTLGFGSRDDWKEKLNYLFVRRWYSTAQILPDGRVIVIGGQLQPSYEFVPKQGKGPTAMPFLKNAFAAPPAEGENNIYPFVHLLPDGNLFIFANVYSIIFNYKANNVVKNLPKFGKDPRVYPYSGTSVMLPLTAADNFSKATIFICGGSTLGGYATARKRNFKPALDTCGRIEVTANNPSWSVEKMPGRRVMLDGMILPTGEILLVNGMQDGVLGWNQNRNPQLSPYLYNPTTKVFTVETKTNIVRAYHSSANMQSDGTVLIAGGNDQSPYKFTGVRFPTELRIEKYYPYYLNAAYNKVRLAIYSVPGTVKWGTNFLVQVKTPGSPPTKVQVSVYAPSFTTHGNSMNQRMVILKQVGVITDGGAGKYNIQVTAPPNGNIAPPGYYMLTVLNTATAPAIPSMAKWVQFTA